MKKDKNKNKNKNNESKASVKEAKKISKATKKAENTENKKESGVPFLILKNVTQFCCNTIHYTQSLSICQYSI